MDDAEALVSNGTSQNAQSTGFRARSMEKPIGETSPIAI